MHANDIREDLISAMDQCIVDEIEEVYPGGVEQFLHEHR